jgi:hypothetical protein
MNTIESYPRGMRSEVVLLLDCSRTILEPGVSDRIKRLGQSDLDWEYLIGAASWHGILPLLCYNLNRLCADRVPLAWLQELQTRFRMNSARNLFLAAELLKILKVLERNGIPAVAFKGPMLALEGYGNLGLRQFQDLDVLVKEKDFSNARELFLSLGYRPWRKLTPLEEKQHFQSNHAYTLVRSDDGLSLDLHWRITQERYAFGLDVESLWSRLARTSFCGQDVFCLSREDLLLVLCIHGSKHCWERLAWVCDVAEVIRAYPGLDWDAFMGRAQALKIEKPVILGLKLATKLLAAGLPDSVSAKIEEHRDVRLVSRLICKRLFARVNQPLGLIEHTLLFWLTGEGFKNRLPHLGYTFRRVFIPTEHDIALVSLPRAIWFLYYPLRFIRLTTFGIGITKRR